MTSAVWDAKETECCICHHEFTDPKTLPCGHLLCSQCVVCWLDCSSRCKTNSNSNHEAAGCPLCRRAIADPEQLGERRWGEVTEALATDFAMEALVESARVLTEDRACAACEGEVTSVCLHCRDLLCDGCARAHQRLSLTRHHVVDSLTCVTPERLATSRPAFCSSQHQGALPSSNLFCVQHGLAVCNACAIAEHRACPEVRRMEDVARVTDEALAALTRKLAAAEDDLDDALCRIDASLQQVDRREEAAAAQVDEACDQLLKLIEKSRQEFKAAAGVAHAQVRTALAEVKALLGRRRRAVASHKRVLAHVTALWPCPSLTEQKVRFQKRVAEFNISTDVPQTMVLPAMPSINIDASAMKRIQAELRHLVRQEVRPKEPDLVFHENRGVNIVLSDDRKTAERMAAGENPGQGLVVSRDPLQDNVLYQVRIDQMTDNWNYTLRAGVTGTHPGHLLMNYWYEDFDDYLIVCHCALFDHGETISTDYGKALANIRVGSRVGLLVNSSGDLHLYIDDHDQGVAKHNVPSPCHAVFDIRNRVTKVTALPPLKLT